MARKVRATAKAVGATGAATRFRAPAIIPRSSMDEFARELNRIKHKLTRLVHDLGPRIKRAKDRMKEDANKIKAEKAEIAALKKKVRDSIRAQKAANKKKYAQEEAAIKAKLAAYEKSKKWLGALDFKVSALNDGQPGAAKYELNLAEIKTSLADNSDTADDMFGTDLSSDLTDLETSRSLFDVDTASDLEISKLKLYETARLKHLLQRMHKSLAKNVDKAKKRLDEIHKVKVPANLHMGLRRAEENLKLLKHRYEKAKFHYNRLLRTDIPRLGGAKRELKKIARIERHIFTAGGSGKK